MAGVVLALNTLNLDSCRKDVDRFLDEVEWPVVYVEVRLLHRETGLHKDSRRWTITKNQLADMVHAIAEYACSDPNLAASITVLSEMPVQN
ncbi:MAG: hypothetical protein IVW54_10645 [Candidatus Binataceae bacterium]|nr:hypothetical protein [Candidatus Binataceae bacterium]